MLIRLCGGKPLIIRGRRIHHGLTGLVLAAVGVALMVDDIADCFHWIPDFKIKDRR